MLAAAIGSAVVALVALIGKEFAKTTATALYAWSAAFILMPQTIKTISQRVDEIDARLGRNGNESVFDMLHVLHDASDATIMKERLRADREGVMMWHSDKNGHCVWASKGLQQLVGSTFDERFRGMNWLNLFLPEDRESVGESWTNSISNGDPFILRTRYAHAEGHEVPVRIEAYPLPGGAVFGLVTRL